jgi:predicted AAA+ superfamily ATPase
MEHLIEKSELKINRISGDFSRSLMDVINWDARLIAIKGARGVGKTTLLLQYLKKNVSNPNSRLYVSLDALWFAENTLSTLADWFVKRGGRYLFLDEVHKYPNWSQEIKNTYDDHPDLQIVFTGSSLLEILNARADLSRRAVSYQLQGLSFREFLNLTLQQKFPVLSLEDLLENHQQTTPQIVEKIKPLQHFSTYLKSGYYPFFLEQSEVYHTKIEEVVNFILEVELPQLRQMEMAYVNKIKQLLQIIATSVPFMPNVTKLSQKIQINRNTLVTYLHYLNEAHLTKNLYRNAHGISKLQKPDKMYLENTNLLYALAGANSNTGNLRETFFLNQLGQQHTCTYTQTGDFLVNDTYTFEVGGENKTTQQIDGVPNAYIAADNIEIGTKQKIPLWLFGFLY